MARSKISLVFRGADGRIRSGWRLMPFTILFVGLSGLVSLVLRWLIGKLPADPALKNLFLVGLAGAVATVEVLGTFPELGVWYTSPKLGAGVARGRRFLILM
jgi:hypothetical protein